MVQKRSTSPIFFNYSQKPSLIQIISHSTFIYCSKTSQVIHWGGVWVTPFVLLFSSSYFFVRGGVLDLFRTSSMTPECSVVLTFTVVHLFTILYVFVTSSLQTRLLFIHLCVVPHSILQQLCDGRALFSSPPCKPETVIVLMAIIPVISVMSTVITKLALRNSSWLFII